MKTPNLLTLAAVLGTFSLTAIGQASPIEGNQAGPPEKGLKILVPESAGRDARDIGVRSHTDLRVLVVPNVTAPAATAQVNTPSTIRALYSLPATGGSNAIAIVDAYHYPTALADFNGFSQAFNLPQESSKVATNTNATFQVVYANGVKPMSGGDYIASWNMEEALDIEWAHAMAPQAKIYLVEAASASNADLTAAVRVASSLPGVKEVSMSWGGNEFSYEASYDSVFTTPGVVYLASGGDCGAVMEYPAASPNVISCGGTTVTRNSRGVLTSETGWSDTGCGVSAYEPRPRFQNCVASVVGSFRGVSDMSFDADPNTGVYIYDTTPLWGETGWWILGGTSVSAPALAGIVNAAGTINGFAANTAAEEARIYGNMGNVAAFKDITSGKAGQFSCSAGYDVITGVGTPRGLAGK